MSISIIIAIFVSLVNNTPKVSLIQDGHQIAAVWDGQSCCIAVFLGGYSKQIFSENIRYWDINGEIWELNSQHCWLTK